MFIAWLVPIIAQSTISETNATLQTIKDIGIALFSLVVLALGIISVIVVQRRNPNNEAIQALREVHKDYQSFVEDYKRARDEAIQSKDEQAEKYTDALIVIGDAHKGSVDILARMEKWQVQEDVTNAKRDQVLAALPDTLIKIIADTPLLPRLEEINRKLEEIKLALEGINETIAGLTISGETQAIVDRLDAMSRLLELDIREWTERLAAADRVAKAADRIAKALDGTPVVEDILEPPKEDNHEPPPTP